MAETRVKGQERHGSGEAIVTKKRFVPEKFYHVHVDMNGKFTFEQHMTTCSYRIRIHY